MWLWKPSIWFFFFFIDTRIYDAYVIYEMECLDKATEEGVSKFITKTLPSVLEDKYEYRLFIHGRDDIPGQGQRLVNLLIILYLFPLFSIVHGVYQNLLVPFPSSISPKSFSFSFTVRWLSLHRSNCCHINYILTLFSIAHDCTCSCM